jgi:hypothetical protein
MLLPNPLLRLLLLLLPVILESPGKGRGEVVMLPPGRFSLNKILQESARICKNNDSVRFLITLNRLDYSGLLFRIIFDY